MAATAALAISVVCASPLSGCARRSGWERIDRVCDASSPPRVCFDASPDAPATLRVGGAVLVPGECAVSPRRRGGRLRVEVHDGRTGVEPTVRRIGTRRGATTWVRHGPEGLDVERRSCSTDVDSQSG